MPRSLGEEQGVSNIKLEDLGMDQHCWYRHKVKKIRSSKCPDDTVWVVKCCEGISHNFRVVEVVCCGGFAEHIGKGNTLAACYFGAVFVFCVSIHSCFANFSYFDPH